jgi:peptide/nickel transport system substrate-binding protein
VLELRIGRRQPARWLGLLFLGALLAGCVRSPSSSPLRGQLDYALGTEITSLDPVRVTEDNPRLVSQQVMETLVAYDQDLHLRPLLAQSWESSEGGKVWRFKLRSNVAYQNDPCFAGKRQTLQAADVVYSLRRLLDPKTQTLGAFILSDIVEGADALAKGSEGAKIGIVAEDPLTVAFHLTKPYALLPARLSLPFAAVVPESAVRYYGDQWGSHPVGSGPFQIARWDRAAGVIELKRNHGYWRQLATNVERLRFTILKSDVSQLALFRQGKIDAFELRPSIVGEVLSSSAGASTRLPHARLLERPILKVHFVGFNFRNAPANNLNFRRALNYAVDKRALTEKVLNGLALPATSPLLPGLPGYDSSPLYAQDLVRARELLRASGYDGRPLAYTTDNSTESVAVAEFLEQQLAAIGVSLRIDKNPESIWLDKLTSGNFDLGKLYFAADYPASDNPLSQFLTANFSPVGPNFLHYSNPIIDHLYESSLGAAGEGSFRQMNDIVRSDAPWIFLYYPLRAVVVRDTVEGIGMNALSFSLLLDRVKVKVR